MVLLRQIAVFVLQRVNLRFQVNVCPLQENVLPCQLANILLQFGLRVVAGLQPFLQAFVQAGNLDFVIVPRG